MDADPVKREADWLLSLKDFFEIGLKNKLSCFSNGTFYMRLLVIWVPYYANLGQGRLVSSIFSPLNYVYGCAHTESIKTEKTRYKGLKQQGLNKVTLGQPLDHRHSNPGSL